MFDCHHEVVNSLPVQSVPLEKAIYDNILSLGVVLESEMECVTSTGSSRGGLNASYFMHLESM